MCSQFMWCMAGASHLMAAMTAPPRTARIFNFKSDDEKWLRASWERVVRALLWWDGMKTMMAVPWVHHAVYWMGGHVTGYCNTIHEMRGQCDTDPIYRLNIKQSTREGAHHEQLRAWKLRNLNLMFILNFAPLLLHFEAIDVFGTGNFWLDKKNIQNLS